MESLDRSFLLDLVTATREGDFESMVRLLEQGVRPDLVDHQAGWSALHAAVLFQPQALETMLRYCTNPDTPQVAGGTPLSYVIHELGENPDAKRQGELLDSLAVLLRSGANPRAGGSDQSPLELSRLYNLPEIEKLLLGSQA